MRLQGSGRESQREVVVEETTAMGGRHTGVSIAILTNGRGTSIDLLDDEAILVAEAIREVVQGGGS